MVNGYGNEYTEQGRRFLAKAWEEFAADDLHQASEKGWGAAAQMVKAYATLRGLDHNSHGRLIAAVGRLVAETDDDSFRTLFHEAGGLHRNFYEGGLTQRDLRGSLEQVTAFVNKVESVLNGS